jgi:class 3 adenylate cyclase
MFQKGANSTELTTEELADTIEHFDAATAHIIAHAGGRVVKTIGAEVMFTAPDTVRGAEVALAMWMLSQPTAGARNCGSVWLPGPSSRGRATSSAPGQHSSKPP